MPAKVFVTGATGFVAQHLIAQLLEEDYKVIGTVRSATKGDKLKSLFQNHNFEYFIVKDLVNSKEDFDKALKEHADVEYVFHTASPVFPENSTDPEEDMIKPGILGTRNVLLSVEKNLKSLKKFVYTSSLAAVRTEKHNSADELVTEKTWNKVTLENAKNDPGSAYEASKTFGEKEVWNFFDSNDVNFSFTIINPVYIFGPQLFDEYATSRLNFSCEIINSLLKKEDQKIQGNSIDVRDVAKAHIATIGNPETDGERLITALTPYTQQTILDILNENFPELEGKIEVGDKGSDKRAFEESYTLDNSRTKRILGFEFIPLEKTIIDTASQILKVQKATV